MNRPNLRTITTSIVAAIIPTTLLIGTAVTAYFKNTNPDNVDITQGLAYLQQTMTISIITFALLVIISVLGIIKMYREDHNFTNAKLPLVLLVSITIMIFAVALINNYTNQVQNRYLIDHGRPTLDQYFNELKKQESK